MKIQDEKVVDCIVAWMTLLLILFGAEDTEFYREQVENIITEK